MAGMASRFRHFGYDSGRPCKKRPQNESSAERRFLCQGVAFGVLSAVSMAAGTLLTSGAAGSIR